MGNAIQSCQAVVDAAWALAMGVIADGVTVAGLAQGYVAAATVGNKPIRALGYVPQNTGAQRSVKSSSASDGVAGVGAQSILLTYLDSNMAVHQETLVLNGVTGVNTVGTDIRFVESMVIATCGTNAINVGNITLQTATAGGGSAMAEIVAADGATFYAHHFVPAGMTCYVLGLNGGATLAVGRSFLAHTGDPRTVAPILQIGDILIHLAGDSQDHNFSVPLVVVGPDYIFMQENPVTAVANNTAYGSFDYIQMPT